ncbi:MAG: glycosyltransferase [Methylococcales bacterium]|nr:glycosyltransferase [Methylococcales bacterium]
MSVLQNLIEKGKKQFDLTEVADRDSLSELTNQLLNLPNLSLEELKQAAMEEDTPLEFKIAAKLVDSRRFMLSNKKPLHIGVVFAMWGEHNRLLPKSVDNPNGENSLRVKLQQLEWITRDTNVNWTVYAVDDGDPNDSGAIVASIAAEHPLGDHVKVLYLAKAVPTTTGSLAALASADDSRKGGAIIFGCMQAIEDGVDAVIYTDADNSVHLGQIGLVLKPFLQDDIRVVLGNRKHPEAVLVKVEGRWGIGIKALRHMQRMIGQAIFSRDIRDTQAALKLYEAKFLSQIIQNPTVFDFSFDTDWILATLAAEESFVKVPFAFIDSAAESASIAQGPMTTWEILLKGLVKAVRKHGVPHNEAMARVLDEEILSSADLDAIINHLPQELENVSEADLGNPNVMSPEAMKEWIHERRKEAGLI